MPKFYRFTFIAALLLAIIIMNAPDQSPKTYYEVAQPGPRDPGKMSGAAHAMDMWWSSRAYPGDEVTLGNYTEAFAKHQNSVAEMHKTQANGWESIGPHNIGGRTLRIMFNPGNEQTLYAGSAAGGLWRSYSAGQGAEAWEHIPTGFPVLGVAAIAINPLDTNEMYIGTGEVYNYQKVGNRLAIRTTRGSYGIGILKPTDAGATWTKSLDWAYDDLKGVQDLLINPQNPSSVLAATSEGIYRSLDAGTTWTLTETALMGTDLIYHPADTAMVIAGIGNFASTGAGLYRSTNGGASFTKITAGLPPTFTGKITLSVTSDAPYHFYASIADSLSGIGLYRSTDLGLTWSNINSTDYATYQGWYSHDVGVSPSDRNWVMCTGVDTWKSADGGTTLGRVSYWYNWFINYTPPIGGQEGSADYVHADIHEVVYHPSQPDWVYFATDGGVFRSTDKAQTFEGLNGKLQTTQFYANFANSVQDSNIALGGMQDNASAVYQGTKAWYKVIGGDGCHAEINPNNDQIMYGSAQRLYLTKSTDRGQFFGGMTLPAGATNVTAFVSPYTLCRSNPNVLYAGGDAVYKTTDGGNNWTTTALGGTINGAPVLKIIVDPNDCDRLWASMVPGQLTGAQMYHSTDGANSWTNVTSNLPDRYYHDIAIHPTDPDIIYVALGGFGTDHIYVTTDAGSTWSSISAALPDVPANNVFVDPLSPNDIYVANDLGVYVSQDAGATWNPFSTDLPEAVIAMDLSYSAANRKIRLATHGSGNYEADLLGPASAVNPPVATLLPASLAPNPADITATLSFELGNSGQVSAKLIDLQGKLVLNLAQNQRYQPGQHNLAIPTADLSEGIYLVRLETGDGVVTRRLVVQH